MEHRLEWSVGLLERTPGALDALLRGLPVDWLLGNKGGTMERADVVAHLNHGERADWIPRARMVLEHRETKRLCRLIDSDTCMRARGSRWRNCWMSFRDCASKICGIPRNELKEEDLQQQGRHPALGVVTLSELLATWAVHHLNHLHQISRILAYPYREVVGPWSTISKFCSLEGIENEASIEKPKMPPEGAALHGDPRAHMQRRQSRTPQIPHFVRDDR